MVSDIFAMPSNRKKQSNMKNVFVKNTFLKSQRWKYDHCLVNLQYTPPPISTSQKNETYCSIPWIIAYGIGLLCGLWIGPLQLAIHVVQNHHAWEQKSHWDKTNKRYT